MSGLRDLIQRRMDAIDKAGTEPAKKEPPPQPAATKVSAPITSDEAAKKAARFKWERENPGVPYKEPQPGKANGGLVKGAGTGTSDSNLVPMSKGEFVLPADTVKKLGVENLRDLVKQTHSPVPGQPRGLGDGGTEYDVKFSKSKKAYNEFEEISKKNAYERAQRAQVNSLRPDMDAVRRAAGSGGTLPSGGVELPGSVRSVVNSALPKNPTLTAPSLETVTKPVGTALRGVAKVAPLVALGAEAYQAGRDVLDPNVDTSMKVARGAESVGRLASAAVGAKAGAGLGALGGPFAPVTVPAGAIVGGGLGYFAPEVVGASGLMPSNQIDKQRQANEGVRSASGTISTPAPAPAALPPGYVEGAVKAAQAGQFQDQNDRRMAQAGGVAPSPQAKVATQISQGAGATDLAAPDGGGYISGRDKDGMRRMVGYTKDTMPLPMGVFDTTSPEVKAADMANRERWKAEAAAIDARMAARNQDLADRAERSDYLNKRNVAEYERRDALGRMKRANVYSPAELRALGEEYKAAGYGVLEATRGLQGIDERRENANRVAAAERTAKTRDELGLRGTMYAADKKLEGDVLQAGATRDAAALKARYDMLMKGVEAKSKNREARDKWAEARFTTPVVNKEGVVTGNAYNPQAYNQFLKEVVTAAATNPKFLGQFKNDMGQPVTDLDELTQTQWDQIHQGFMKRAAIAQNVNASADSGDDPVTGAPTGLRVSRTKGGDWVNFSGDPEQNAMGIVKTAWGAYSPFAGTGLKYKIGVKGETGKTQNRFLGDVIKNGQDAEQVAQMLESSGIPEQIALAKQIRQTYNPPLR